MNFIQVLTQFIPALSAAAGIIQQLWPQTTPVISAVTQVPMTQHNSATELLQSILNELQTAGVISFGAPLKVDGLYGAHTNAAVMSIFTKFGINLGPLEGLVQNVITSLLAKL